MWSVVRRLLGTGIAFRDGKIAYGLGLGAATLIFPFGLAVMNVPPKLDERSGELMDKDYYRRHHVIPDIDDSSPFSRE